MYLAVGGQNFKHAVFFNFCDQAIILLHTELETQRLEEFTERTQLQNGKTIFKQMQHRTWIHPHFCIESNGVHLIENVYNVPMSENSKSIMAQK